MQNFKEIGPVVCSGEYPGTKNGCASFNSSQPVEISDKVEITPIETSEKSNSSVNEAPSSPVFVAFGLEWLRQLAGSGPRPTLLELVAQLTVGFFLFVQHPQ